MITTETVRELAMTFEGAEEMPHFEKASFRVKKKIFATIDDKNKRVTVKFTEIEQSLFGAFDKSIIYPVQGAWGKKGYTLIELNKVKKEVLTDALRASYCNVAPAKLAAKYKGL